MPEEGEKRVYDSIARILIVQTWVSGILALAIVVSAVGIPIYASIADKSIETPSEIRDWGGVIIGFYFGSALTQMGSLLSSLRTKDAEKTP